MAFGLHVWPLGVTMHVNPGRIRFDNDLLRDPPEPPEPVAGARTMETERARRYGLMSLWMWFALCEYAEPVAFVRHARVYDRHRVATQAVPHT